MRKVIDNQTTFEQGGFDNSGLIVDGNVDNPNAGSTVKSWAINDVLGAFAAILKGAGIESFNGQPETEDSSQVLAAIQELINNKANEINQNVSNLMKYTANLKERNVFTNQNLFTDYLIAENYALFNKGLFAKVNGEYKLILNENSILAYNYMNANDVTNLINSKIDGLKQELEEKYVTLAGNNVFTGTNTFSGSVNTNSSVNHQTMPNHRGSSLIDSGDLNSKGYATKSYVSSSISNKISVDTTSSSSESHYNVGSILWGRYNPAASHPNLNQRVYVRRLNSYLLEVTSTSQSGSFSGVWRAKGSIDEVDLEGSSLLDSATLVLVQRVG